MAYVSNMKTRQPGQSTGLGIDRLQALQAFNARLVCMTVNESSYDEVVNGVWKVLGCDACALFLLDQATKDLVMVGSVGYPDVPSDLRVSLSDLGSIHAQSLNEEYLIHVEDLNGKEGAKPLSPRIADNLVLPIISNNGPVGVFDFASLDPGTFDEQEIGMCSMLVDQMSYSLENIRLVGELSQSRDAVIRGMALLAEIRDPHIGGHLDRICEHARLLAERLSGRPGYQEVTHEFMQTIAQAAALHDVGKVGIPDSILMKPAKLSEAEFDIMKTHTMVGADLLEGLRENFGDFPMIAMGVDVAIGHHEWWNGSGYPRGSKGREIPLAARILAICDVYDALTSNRVYKKAWTHEETEKTIREGAGSQFDPDLVEIFFEDQEELIQVREKYPG
ncbi:MAG: HD domain-containing phosphohydrolase [Candidatus Krumholzibacteriota bacterium]